MAFFCHTCDTRASVHTTDTGDVVCDTCGEGFVEELDEAATAPGDSPAAPGGGLPFGSLLSLFSRAMAASTQPVQHEPEAPQAPPPPQQPSQPAQMAGSGGDIPAPSNIHQLLSAFSQHMPPPGSGPEISQHGGLTVVRLNANTGRGRGGGGDGSGSGAANGLPFPFSTIFSNLMAQSGGPQQYGTARVWRYEPTATGGHFVQGQDESQHFLESLSNLMFGGGDSDSPFSLDRFMERIVQSMMDQEEMPNRSPPTARHILEHMPTHRITKEEAASGLECTICQDYLKEGDDAWKLSENPEWCSHMFHVACIRPWLEQHNTCPVCRYELPTDDEEYERRKRERRDQLQRQLSHEGDMQRQPASSSSAAPPDSQQHGQGDRQ
ncbi:unnamed protein product [Vitrella brassicaformis CCMP3155]|uniref:RING-type E3 ubiquitin transferase n=1 Tax=Vitrella brassicaformis (strain CCMP3155) TaxID=1169540 RepID=A0A0G4FKA0_VITBC|nr:unnamed protein product [Vitrella brassicaformis CCMP3155]|eukprot:CEM13987.1 unnamed protein product [Vitrella brassicaformis CCMP3155]